MSPRQLIRLFESRKNEEFDDQKTAAEVANSEVLSETESDFQQYLLSQIKRIIHGDDSGNWYDDPVTVFGHDVSLKALLSGATFKDVACLSSDAVGDFVCTRDDRINGKWRVEKADPEDEAKMPAIGVLVSKSTPTVGVMQTAGPVYNLFTGLDYTKPIIYLGTTGILYALPPIGVSGYVLVQGIGKATAADVLMLNGNFSLYKRVG